MGHEDFSLIQVVTDFVKEKWPQQPFKSRTLDTLHDGKDLIAAATSTSPLVAIDYDHYGIEWPCIYIIGDVVYVVSNFNSDLGSLKTTLSAADPLFFDKLHTAIEAYLSVIGEELFLP